MMPPRVRRALRRSAWNSSLYCATYAGSCGSCFAGTLKFGVRWKTVTWAACSAIRGIAWTAVEPVPITPTRLPAKSTPSCGQRAVWHASPRNDSRPGISGHLGFDRQPVAMMQNCAENRSPASVSTIQRCRASS